MYKRQDKEETYFSVRLYEQDSLVLCLQPEKEVKVQAAEIFEDEEIVSETNWQGLVEYELSEENVLLLDQAEYCLLYTSSNPIPATYAQIAQLVEQRTCLLYTSRCV